MYSEIPGVKNDSPVDYNEKIKNYLNVLEIISQSTDDFLFLLDIKKDENWFFGPVDRDYALRDKGLPTNTTAEMVKIVHPGDRAALNKDLKEIADGVKDVHNMDYRWVNRWGELVWINCRGKVINDENGKPFVMIGRVSEEALRHLYSPLTGLFNKTKMMMDLKNDFPSAAGGYIMLVDIDELSAINLSQGRDFGDNVLKSITAVLEGLPEARKVYDIEHRYFALFLNAETEQDVQRIYSEIQEAMFEKCTISAGVVPFDNNIFIDEKSLYDSAKLTLRKAKSQGKSSIAFFSEAELERKITAVRLLEEMQESVKNNFEGFYLNYQPQVKAGSYNLFGVEALLRYTSKTRGKVFPDEFIPLLEQSGLINQVGMWVLETALKQCKKWRKHLPELRISVNFSAVQFKDRDIAEKVFGILKKTDLPGDVLTVELTESIQLQQSSHLRDRIKHLKDAGIQIAIDDFGTGYSNIGYLKQLYVDEIKIDRIFVKGIEEDTYNYKLISNTIEFAKTNSIRVCCEGVEDTNELGVLEELSPELLQGYLFDKPCDAEEIEQSYIDKQSGEYRKRMIFVRKLYQYKEEIGIIHFNAKDILRETNVGLWIIRINPEDGHYELHADETMERIMAVDKKYTPQECYRYWHDRIKEEYLDYVHKNIQHMIEINKVVQLQYPWIHPTLGEVLVRSNGRRTEDSDGMIVLEGYHRIFSNIEDV